MMRWTYGFSYVHSKRPGRMKRKYPEDGFETSRPERSITVCLKVPRALVVDFRKALSLASEPVASVFPAARAAADARQSPMMKVRRVSSVI
jgi:hypothetical protein